MLVPVVVAVVANSYSSVIKQAENRVKYTELAINILQEEPDEQTQAVRAWAIDIVNRYSGVAMSETVREELLGSRLTQSDFEGANFSESIFDNSSFHASTFRGADLSYTLLDGASLRYSSLRGVDLRGADLSSAVIDSETKLPD